MSNLKQEILRLAVDRLQNKVESIMLSINAILSEPTGVNNVVDKVVNELETLALAESALNHSKSLYGQSISLSKQYEESVQKELSSRKEIEK